MFIASLKALSVATGVLLMSLDTCYEVIHGLCGACIRMGASRVEAAKSFVSSYEEAATLPVVEAWWLCMGKLAPDPHSLGRCRQAPGCAWEQGEVLNGA